MNRVVVAGCLMALSLGGCGEFEPEHDGVSAGLTKGTPGANNGDGDYCDDPANRCVDGEGDCDYDAQCTGAGIVCGVDNGLAYDQWWSNDVCWPSTCENGSLDPGEIEIDNGGPCGCWLRTHYRDSDGDNFGRAANRVFCDGAAPAGWALAPGDCRDFDAAINPGATEICGNNVDEDCDGMLDNGCVDQTWCLDNDSDTYPRSTGCVVQSTQPGANWVVDPGSNYDCNDTNAAINPGAAEACNGIDDNCNSMIDEGVTPPIWYLDNDSDTYPRNTNPAPVQQCDAPGSNWVSTVPGFDCNDNDAAINPGAAEACNGIDDNCNMMVDEGVTPPTWYLDNDNDTYPRMSGPVVQCFAPGGNWVQDGTFPDFDCLDTNSSVNPGQPEVCGDGLDNDCNGMIDDSCTVPAHCTNSVQDGNETGVDCGGFCDVCSTGGAPASCAGGLNTCGPSGVDDCCEGATVFGADYSRSYDNVGFTDPSNTATIFSTYMDKYEVTVGRFKQFLASYDSWIGSGNPMAGDGAHPIAAGTGWDATWNASLPADSATLVGNLGCSPPYVPTYSAGSANDDLPVTCVTWYEAFAFCVWDGGRLPTEAEWNLAAANGSDQRVYPWSDPPTDTTITTTEAAFGCWLDGDFSSCTINDIASAGSLAAGETPGGIADLAGNAWEWTFDWYSATYPNPCVNCANTTAATFRVIRGGGYTSSDANSRASVRSTFAQGNRSANIGFRCVRGG